MSWSRGPYREGRRAPVPVYIRRLDEVARAPVVPVTAAFLVLIGAFFLVLISDRLDLGASEPYIVALVVPVLAFAMVLALYGVGLRADRQRFLQAAFEACTDEPPDEADLEHLSRLREAALPISRALAFELERAYVQLIHVVVADGVVEAHELERLARMEKLFALPEERVRVARLQGFFDIYDRAIQDNLLTAAEEVSIAQIRAALDIPEREVRRELAFARELSRARSVRREPLEPVRANVNVRLRASERAVYMTMGAHKKPVQRPYAGGHRRTFEVVRAGNLIITDQRLLFEAGSITSIDLAHMVEVDVDAESKYLRVFDDRNVEPYYFDVPQTHMALAYLERVLEQRHAQPG